MQKDVAAKLEVSVRESQRAAKILREDPEVAEKVKLGQYSLDTAERAVNFNKNTKYWKSLDENPVLAAEKVEEIRIKRELDKVENEKYQIDRRRYSLYCYLQAEYSIIEDSKKDEFQRVATTILNLIGYVPKS